MRKHSIADLTQEVSAERVEFIKGLVSRISEALGDIQDICNEELEPKPQPSSFGQFEGIGLYIYVKLNEEPMRAKYPAFTQGEILNILLTQWHQLSSDEKGVYCQKVDLEKVGTSKRLKKLDKMGQKLIESISISNGPYNLEEDEVENNVSIEDKVCKKKPQQIGEQEEFDHFEDNASNPIQEVQCQPIITQTPHIEKSQSNLNAIQISASVQQNFVVPAIQQQVALQMIPQTLQKQNQIMNSIAQNQNNQQVVVCTETEKVQNIVQQQQQAQTSVANSLNVCQNSNPEINNVQSDSKSEELVEITFGKNISIQPSQSNLINSVEVTAQNDDSQKVQKLDAPESYITPLVCNEQAKLDNQAQNLTNEEKHSVQEETPVFQGVQENGEKLETNQALNATQS